MTSVTSHPRAAPQGFSLVELLVVLVIIGLMSSVVVLSLPERESDLDEAARVFAAKVVRATDESVMTGRPLRLLMTEAGYRFETRQQGDWVPASFGTSSDEVKLNAGIVLSKDVLGAEAPSREARQSVLGDQAAVYFLPIGEVTPFSVRLSTLHDVRRIDVSANGETRIDNGRDR